MAFLTSTYAKIGTTRQNFLCGHIALTPIDPVSTGIDYFCAGRGLLQFAFFLSNIVDLCQSVGAVELSQPTSLGLKSLRKLRLELAPAYDFHSDLLETWFADSPLEDVGIAQHRSSKAPQDLAVRALIGGHKETIKSICVLDITVCTWIISLSPRSHCLLDRSRGPVSNTYV